MKHISSNSSAFSIALFIVTAFSCLQTSRAEVPKTVSPKSQQVSPPPTGWIALTGLRLYVSPAYRPYGMALRAGEAEQILSDLRTVYQKSTSPDDLYIIRVQADTPFRQEEWIKYKDLKPADAKTRFRRGAAYLYRFYENRSTLPTGEELNKFLDEATKELELAWKQEPSLMRGAVLMDAYSMNFAKPEQALAFTREFLKYLDPEHSYKAYQQAEAKGFPTGTPVPSNITGDKLYPVCGVLGERWCLLVGNKKRLGKEAEREALMLNQWWRTLGKQIPPIK